MAKYDGSIQIDYDAYDCWKGHDGKFHFYLTDNDSKVCLSKPNDLQNSCIIIGLNVDYGNSKCFVQCRRCRWEPLNGQYLTTEHNWSLGTALYACHIYAINNYNPASSSYINGNPFARGLVHSMKDRGASSDAIMNPFTDVPSLMKWAKQLDINVHVVPGLHEQRK